LSAKQLKKFPLVYPQASDMESMANRHSIENAGRKAADDAGAAFSVFVFKLLAAISLALIFCLFMIG
jgi:hypothetical protein